MITKQQSMDGQIIRWVGGIHVFCLTPPWHAMLKNLLHVPQGYIQTDRQTENRQTNRQGVYATRTESGGLNRWIPVHRIPRILT